MYVRSFVTALGCGVAAASALSTSGVLTGHGPSSNVSTTSLSVRKSSCLKCSKPKPGPPLVSISTTRLTPKASGLAQPDFASAGAGRLEGVEGIEELEVLAEMAEGGQERRARGGGAQNGAPDAESTQEAFQANEFKAIAAASVIWSPLVATAGQELFLLILEALGENIREERRDFTFHNAPDNAGLGGLADLLTGGPVNPLLKNLGKRFHGCKSPCLASLFV